MKNNNRPVGAERSQNGCITVPFGPQPSSELTRKIVYFLEQIIDDPQAKKSLEEITHPKIFFTIAQWEKEQKQAGANATVVEAALMVETGSYQRYDALIVVTCNPKQQIARLMKRNSLTQEQAQNWIATQMPLSEKEKKADWLINNSGSFEDLKQVVADGIATLL